MSNRVDMEPSSRKYMEDFEKRQKEKEPPATLEELAGYLKRDLRWLDGVADALNNPNIRTGITSIKHNLKRLLEMVEEIET